MKIKGFVLAISLAVAAFSFALVLESEQSLSVAVLGAIGFFLLTWVASLLWILLRLLNKVNRRLLTRDRFEQVDRNTRREFRREIANNFHQVEATIQLESLYGFTHALPPSRSWAASPDLVLEVVTLITTRKPQLIVELGSGLSTLWIARMLKENGGGKFVSIDHDPHFAAQTRKRLEAQGLSEFVDLRVGELESQTWDEGLQNWYPHSLVADLKTIDFLLVDGPPRNDSGTYRWPAMWELEVRMSEHATVVLDDVIRDEESELAKAWAVHGGYELDIKFFEKRAGILTR